jgi:DNA-directed RNA polymerase specialized sigma24 family protein
MRQSGYGLTQLLDRLREERCDLTDGVLLVRYAQGDQLAFNTLMKRHGPMVYGTARRIAGDRHVAEDLFQATFLILARKAAAIRWDDSIAGWLHRVVRRLAIRNAAAPHPDLCGR